MRSTTFAENCASARTHLERFADAPLDHIIDGADHPPSSGATFENTTPIDGTRLGDVAAGNAVDVDLAARAARAAFASWASTDGPRRRAILLRLADLIEEHAETIALMESVDTGQAIRFMSQAARRGAENFRFFADRAPSAADGFALPTDQHVNYTTRQPIGPVGVITPWNTPFMLSTWKIAPALAAGCSVVHKPAEWSPLSAQLLAELALEAGLPNGVLNVVHGTGESAGKALTEHPEIAALAFVGESATGARIQAQAAPTLKRVHFELGGKNPAIVFADSDLERAADAVLFMIYSLNGERCTSSSRVLIERSIYAEFTEQLAARLTHIPVGHPLDPNTVIGPLIHRDHYEKVVGYLDAATAEGARTTRGSTFADASSGGHWVSPALFTDATPSMRIAREEIFGPVLTALAFDDEDDAISIANDSEYGLAAYVWTGDVGRAHRVARDLAVGMVWVNSHNVRHLPTPFGGMKQSGVGRDGGDWSFDFYMETKNIAVAYDNPEIPRLDDRSGG